jgi:hypothetical protein
MGFEQLSRDSTGAFDFSTEPSQLYQHHHLVIPQEATPLDGQDEDEGGGQQHEGGTDADQEAAALPVGPNGQPVAVLPSKLHDTLLVRYHTSW